MNKKDKFEDTTITAVEDTSVMNVHEQKVKFNADHIVSIIKTVCATLLGALLSIFMFKVIDTNRGISITKGDLTVNISDESQQNDNAS